MSNTSSQSVEVSVTQYNELINGKPVRIIRPSQSMQVTKGPVAVCAQSEGYGSGTVEAYIPMIMKVAKLENISKAALEVYFGAGTIGDLLIDIYQAAKEMRGASAELEKIDLDTPVTHFLLEPAEKIKFWAETMASIARNHG